MEGLADHCESPILEPKISQDDGTENSINCTESSGRNCGKPQDLTYTPDLLADERLAKGLFQYGYDLFFCHMLANLVCMAMPLDKVLPVLVVIGYCLHGFVLCQPPFDSFTDAHIIDEGVTLGRHAVARFLIVGIATMRPWSVC